MLGNDHYNELVNIHHHGYHSYTFFFLVLTAFRISSLSNFSTIQHSLTGHGHCAVHDGPRTDLSNHWKFLPLELPHPFRLSLPPASGNQRSVLCLWLVFLDSTYK